MVAKSPTAGAMTATALARSPSALLTPFIPITSTIALNVTTSVTSTVLVSPSITDTPTTTPTIGPPTATETPAPSQDTLSAAQTINQELIAFAQAESSGNSGTVLQAQRKLLEAVATAQATASADHSPYGQQLRSALSAAQDGASGNNDRLREAYQDLAQILGTTATPFPTINSPAQASQGLTDIVQNLRNAVDAYSKASSSGNQNDMLQAQKNLIQASAAASAATEGDQSPAAQQIRSALTAIRDGLAGDSGKFAVASLDLGSALNQALTPSATPSPTPTVLATLTPTPTPTLTGTPTPQITPTISPTPSISPMPTISPTPQETSTTTVSATATPSANIQSLASGVDSALQSLQNAEVSQNSSGIAQAQNQLKQVVQQASDGLANDNSPAANRLRNALGAAQSAESGDPALIQAARDQIKAATGQ